MAKLSEHVLQMHDGLALSRLNTIWQVTEDREALKVVSDSGQVHPNLLEGALVKRQVGLLLERNQLALVLNHRPVALVAEALEHLVALSQLKQSSFVVLVEVREFQVRLSSCNGILTDVTSYKPDFERVFLSNTLEIVKFSFELLIALDVVDWPVFKGHLLLQKSTRHAKRHLKCSD